MCISVIISYLCASYAYYFSKQITHLISHGTSMNIKNSASIINVLLTILRTFLILKCDISYIRFFKIYSETKVKTVYFY